MYAVFKILSKNFHCYSFQNICMLHFSSVQKYPLLLSNHNAKQALFWLILVPFLAPFTNLPDNVHGALVQCTEYTYYTASFFRFCCPQTPIQQALESKQTIYIIFFMNLIRKLLSLNENAKSMVI